MLKLVGDDVPSVDEFMTRYRVRRLQGLYFCVTSLVDAHLPRFNR